MHVTFTSFQSTSLCFAEAQMTTAWQRALVALYIILIEDKAIRDI